MSDFATACFLATGVSLCKAFHCYFPDMLDRCSSIGDTLPIVQVVIAILHHDSIPGALLGGILEWLDKRLCTLPVKWTAQHIVTMIEFTRFAIEVSDISHGSSTSALKTMHLLSGLVLHEFEVIVLSNRLQWQEVWREKAGRDFQIEMDMSESFARRVSRMREWSPHEFSRRQRISWMLSRTIIAVQRISHHQIRSELLGDQIFRQLFDPKFFLMPLRGMITRQTLNECFEDVRMPAMMPTKFE